MLAPSNPVPLGRANTGDAVVYGEGLGALHYLQRQDIFAQQQRARAALAAQREKDAAFKDFSSRLNLSDDTGVHFLPQLKSSAERAHEQMVAAMNDASLDRSQKAARYQAIADDHDRLAKAGLRVDTSLKELGTQATTDKRYDRTRTLDKLYNTLYKRDANGDQLLDSDGKPQQYSPLDYDPQSAERALREGSDHLNGVEVYKTYLRGSHPDAITSAKEALPGGRGYRNVASSDVYELTPDGKIKYDPSTNLPVVKATPQSLNYFDSDPVSRQYLDGLEAQHQRTLATAVEKMQNLEELSPQEQQAVQTEQSPSGRRLELFKQGLLEQGYGRQSQTILQKAAPRPRAGRSTANQSRILVDNTYLPGAVIGGEHEGTSGVTSYGMMPAIMNGKPGQQPKTYVGKNVKHAEVVTMSNDGSMVAATQTNQAAGDVSYGARQIFLRSSKTGNVYLGSPAAVEAAKRGDTSLMDAEARKFRAQHPEYKPEFYMEANPVGPSGVQAGSKEEYYQQLQAQEDAFRQAYDQSGGKPNPKLSADMQAVGLLLAGSSKPPRFRSEKELREKADKEYAKVSKTHYVRYAGQDKMRIDGATEYAMRAPKVRKAMDAALADADRRTSPGEADRAAANRGRGPLAGALSPAAPAQAPRRESAEAVAPNKFKFKFKK